MRLHPIQSLVRVGVAATALYALASCVDSERLTAPPQSEPRWTVPSLPDDSIREAAPMLYVARRLPTFGGFWYNEQDQIVVGLTNEADLARAIPLIRPWLGLHQPKGYVSKKVNRSFLELAKYRHVIRQHGFGPGRLISLGVDERANLVTVGVDGSDAASVAAIRRTMLTAGVPDDAVGFTHTRGGRNDGLGNDYPGFVQAGWVIGPAGCTVGFAARRATTGDTVFVTNSHCTGDPGPDVTGAIITNIYGNAIGQEIVDPPFIEHTCWAWTPPGMWRCRNSDAALNDAYGRVDFGRIARPIAHGGSLDIDTTIAPPFRITGARAHMFDGERVEKVGRVTGWTSGHVVNTCVDTWSGAGFWPWDWNTGWVKQCSDHANYRSDAGDSGSPVFWILANGTVELLGIHYAHNSANDNTYISGMNQIQLDLGLLQVAPLYVTIEGPSNVPPNRSCQWSAWVHGGRPPFSYRWSKEVDQLGTGSAVVMNTGTTGYALDLMVTDADGNQYSEQRVVTVDQGFPLPWGCQ